MQKGYLFGPFADRMRWLYMKILVAGLGLIGGSMAKALKRGGYCADGYDRAEVAAAAVAAGAIERAASSFAEYDVVFVALPPDAAMKFIGENHFCDGAVVADICGVKEVIERYVYAVPRNFRYVGCHPMAGKEVSGFFNSCEDLFDGASVIMTDAARTDTEAVRLLETLFRKMGFARIVHCSAQEHDKKIAYTSQLAHIVSNAYVKSETANGYRGFTGGSFQDMTRIAGVDEKVWTRLYFLNRKNIVQELRCLIDHLGQYAAVLDGDDEEALAYLLREGRLRKEELDGQK